MQRRPFEIPLVQTEITSHLSYMTHCCVCFWVQRLPLEEWDHCGSEWKQRKNSLTKLGES